MPNDLTANCNPLLCYNMLFNQPTFQNISYITHPD